MPRPADMTTVQLPKWFVRKLPRLQVHRRQPFYEIIVAAFAALDQSGTDARGDEPP